VRCLTGREFLFCNPGVSENRASFWVTDPYVRSPDSHQQVTPCLHHDVTHIYTSGQTDISQSETDISQSETGISQSEPDTEATPATAKAARMCRYTYPSLSDTKYPTHPVDTGCSPLRYRLFTPELPAVHP